MNPSTSSCAISGLYHSVSQLDRVAGFSPRKRSARSCTSPLWPHDVPITPRTAWPVFQKQEIRAQKQVFQVCICPQSISLPLSRPSKTPTQLHIRARCRGAGWGWMGWRWCGPDALPFLLLDEGNVLLWNKKRGQLLKRWWQLSINVNYNGQWIFGLNFTFQVWDSTAAFSGECEGFLFHSNSWDVLACCHLYVGWSRTERLFKTRAGIYRNQSSPQRFVKEVLGLIRRNSRVMGLRTTCVHNTWHHMTPFPTKKLRLLFLSSPEGLHTDKTVAHATHLWKTLLSDNRRMAAYHISRSLSW